MIGHDDLGLPEDLAQQFAAWIDGYEADDTPDLPGFERAGLELARELKSFLGPQVYVEFEPEPINGVKQSAIIIE
jgi:hypothetical protein